MQCSRKLIKTFLLLLEQLMFHISFFRAVKPATMPGPLLTSSECLWEKVGFIIQPFFSIFYLFLKLIYFNGG